MWCLCCVHNNCHLRRYALLSPPASSGEGGCLKEPHCVIIGWSRRERRGRGWRVTAEALGKDDGGVGRKEERQDPVEAYFSADSMRCQSGIHDHHCIPLICVSTDNSRRGCIFWPLILEVGVGLALGIQPNSPHPRPSPPLTRKSLSPGEG